MDIMEAKKLVLDGGKRLLNSGLVNGTWGNISQKIDSESMVITPSGKDYTKLTIDDIVLVNIHTLNYEGNLKPSSECELHAELYKSRKEIGAVIHTHSLNACIVAAARKEIPPILDDMVQIVGPSIRVTEYAISGTKKLQKNIIKSMKGRNGVLLANHGAVCVGRSLEEAFITCHVLEKACKVYIDSQIIGGAVPLNKLEAAAMHQYYLKFYSKKRENT